MKMSVEVAVEIPPPLTPALSRGEREKLLPSPS